VGLISRALEMAGISSVVTSWNKDRTEPLRPPRATYTQLGRGSTLGKPGDGAQQRRVLDATLALLEQPAPCAAVLEES
jgi:hypothetical protein